MIKEYLPSNEIRIAIYCLVDPRYPEIIRYIGQSKTPRVRHVQHLSDNLMSAKSEWVESLRQNGILPQMIIFEWVKENEGNIKEIEYINKFKSDLLTNTLSPKIIKNTSALTNLSPRQIKERDIIVSILNKNNGNKSKCAYELGISRATVYKRIKQLGLNCDS